VTFFFCCLPTPSLYKKTHGKGKPPSGCPTLHFYGREIVSFFDVLCVCVQTFMMMISQNYSAKNTQKKRKLKRRMKGTSVHH
jgi:hypothetical protein